MEVAGVDIYPRTYSTSNGLHSSQHKRLKVSSGGKDHARSDFPAQMDNEIEQKTPQTSSKVIDYTDPFAVSKLLERLDGGKYGSVTKEIDSLLTWKTQVLNPLIVKYPALSNIIQGKECSKLEIPEGSDSVNNNVIDLEDDSAKNGLANAVLGKSQPIVIIDSDEEDNEERKPSYPFEGIILPRGSGEFFMKDIVDIHSLGALEYNRVLRGEEASLPTETLVIKKEKDKGVYVGVEDEADQLTEIEDDGLGDIWIEMNIALECSKDVVADPSSPEQESDVDEDCDHSFVLKDDLGYVCRICGVIDRGIETIFEFQYNKVKRSTRTYSSESQDAVDKESGEIYKISGDDLKITEITAHPRHLKQMKVHQMEGFNFLVSNLVGDNPGGCILAHAPGSGKTFMIISFMQSFLAKYPHGRPLVILPKGILSTWKGEFQKWQVEDLPLYDFYSAKAENRTQQLEVLKKWVENKSILFLGYKQFASIVFDDETSKISASCQEILLKAPTIVIMDEGHTPRNEETDTLQSLAKIQTPRKVVLSGTLYQNHVKEVFNILNLVRPKFIRSESSRPIAKRIMSRVEISGRKQFKGGGESTFYDLVEHTLQKDKDFRRKVNVIQDLREMTSKVLHYYKGDSLEELPGLVDLTVVLNLCPKLKKECAKLKKHTRRKFKISSVGSALFLHPKLTVFSDNSKVIDHEMDDFLEKIDPQDGLKARFFLNMINLCEASGEKLLVFSQYLTPLKFLERLVVKTKGWNLGTEMFVITGNSEADQRESDMYKFNTTPKAKVFFGSIKACGEGISLVGASRIIILDVHLNPSVTRQAIGRAFRPGQTKKVFTYRLVAADSPEEEDHGACFEKELISKMWFEWNEYCGYRDFQVETVDVKECGDPFFDSPALAQDVKVLYKR